MFSLLLCPCPWPPRLPWCFLAPLVPAAPRDGKASVSSTAGIPGEGVGSRERWRLVGREPEEPYDEDIPFIEDALGSNCRFGVDM